MAEEQEGQGFTVRDRRIFSPDRQESPPSEKREEPPTEKREQPSETKGAAGRAERPAAEEIPLPEPTFSAFLTSFFLPQILTFLGEIPHPETQQPERNLTMAKYLIDTLAMIREKTKGNLTPEEQKHFENLLADLRMLYVKAVRA